MVNNSAQTLEKQDLYEKCKTGSNRDLEEECVSHMYNHGFHSPPSLPLNLSGKRVNFSGRTNPNGKKLDKTEWYIASIKENGSLIVTYNSHHDTLKRDDHYVFNSRANKSQDEMELKSQKERVAALQQKRKMEECAEEKKRQEKAKRDRERFNKASENGQSIYLIRKRVGAHGLRFEKIGNETVTLVPMRDENGEIQALQEIYETKRIFGNEIKPRDKNFTNAVKGLFHVIGKIVDGQLIRVSEGYATAASCYESTECVYPHVVAFSVGAYKTIIPILRKLYPNSSIIICADNNVRDNSEEENTGVKEAEKAAKETTGCSLTYPIFHEGKERNEEGNRYADFNDLMIVEGKEEVRMQIENNTDLNNKEEDAFLIDDQAENECSSTEISKATANARRRALTNQSTLDEIIRDIRKQHPTLKDQAKDIATKALLWTKNFQIGCEVIVNGIPKTITDMKSLDSRLAQLEAPGQPCVIINRKDALPITNADYNKRLSGEVVVVGVNEKGQPKYIAANKYWEGNTHKHIYRNIVFTNKPTNKNDYNLFTGFGIKPKQGNCNKILNHIKEVVCSDNEINSNALLDLNAWQVQNIGRPSRIITALQSVEQQIGKGCYCNDILAPIFGNSGFTTSDIGQIIGRFNDTIRGKAFIFLDECLFAGDRKAADAIKSLATATRIGVESKGVPTVQFPCATNLFLSTNHADAAHIEEADARYWILEVSPHRKGDTHYFEDLYEEINGGGLSAFLYYLLNRDVRGFVPQRDVPIDNEAKNKMIRNSINPFDARKWLEECCLARMILGCSPREEYKQAGYKWELWKEGEEYENGIFFTAYAEWQKNIKSPVGPKPTAANNFGALLNTAGLELRIQVERRRTLPDPIECLRKVTEMLEKKAKK